MSVPMAIALSGQSLLGQPVMVKPSEAEKNLVQSTTATAGPVGGFIGPYLGGTRRVCSFLLSLLCRSSKCWLELSLRYSYLLLPRYLVLHLGRVVSVYDFACCSKNLEIRNKRRTLDIGLVGDRAGKCLNSCISSQFHIFPLCA